MNVQQLAQKPIFEYSSAELASVVTHCFEDYVAPFKLEGAQFDYRFRPEDLDPKASCVWVDGEETAALALIARRGWTCRLAAMAVAKAYRAHGVGKFVMETVIAQARDRGDHRMVLEVIEQNPPAIGLYERVGFNKVRRLAGYVRPYRPGQAAGLEEIDPLVFCRSMVSECNLDLPWDLVPETLSAKAPPTRAWTLQGRSFALVTDTPAERAVLWAVYTRRSDRGQGHGKRLIEAIGETLPGKTLVTPVAVPDDLAPAFFESAGFHEAELSQFEMAVDLVSHDGSSVK